MVIMRDPDFIKMYFDGMKNSRYRVVMTSGGCDPVHGGHISCFKDSRQYGDFLVVVINGDEFLIQKKGKAFMPLEERMRIVDAIRYVDIVIPWYDMDVIGALKLVRPNTFTKGGSDRSKPEEIPEWQICQDLGIDVKFGVGGFDKIASSSNYLNNWKGKSNEKE